jgi:anti-sigma regulatory factor (Ser/Thr protein kinase)
VDESLSAWIVPHGDTTAASAARLDFGHLLQRLGIPDAQAGPCVVIFGELVANSIEHGSGDVTAQLSRRARSLVLSVSDDGPGAMLETVMTPDPSDPRGRGLYFVKMLARDLRVVRDEGTARVDVTLPVAAPRGTS